MNIEQSKTNTALWCITGEVNFATVVELRKQGDQLMAKSPDTELYFDFSKAQCSDSSGLGLIVVWMRRAKQLGKQLQIMHMPTSLLRIAEICGVMNIIETRICDEPRS